ncbi:MAG: DNA repair ATPase [Cytophagales bacterium]|nr:DNA repair ATPase [Cytophagales bacterium]
MADENPQNALEGGTYELLRNRILNKTKALKTTLSNLNEERKRVFGTIETKVLATDRITTANNCIPWDMHAIGNNFLFGYNVMVGLRSELKPTDVFAYFEFRDDQTFHELPLESLLKDQIFLDDFQKLYKYYKHTQFLRFAIDGPFMHMVFRIGQDVNDIKTFKWELKNSELVYVDNRSDHEYKFPAQHEFQWNRTRREDFREGEHPHISIKDRVFVETVGGDLTVKIEDNTQDGEGIYSEDVANKQQTLADGEFHFSEIGSLILIKAKPYQEEERYLVFNEKLKEVKRIDAISSSCILLPDDHGLIFSNGYYLQSGEYKQFDYDVQDMLFERKITSLNGEDFLYVFYNRPQGIFLLLSYNIIAQKVENPIICHGFTIFENGEMCIFRADEEPKKHHTIQIWQTPFTGPNFQAAEKTDSFLQKIGNKDVVRAMAECQDIINLINKEEIYTDLYIDVIKKATDVIDSYHWLAKEEQYNLAKPLADIRQVAESAVDEYEKVRKIKENSLKRVTELAKKQSDVLKKSKASFGNIIHYVDLLTEVREVRGEIISAKDLRYVDVAKLETFDEELAQSSDNISQSCVRFLMQDHSLAPFIEKVDDFEKKIEKISKVIEADKLKSAGEQVASELDLLIDTVSNLKISDTTQTTRIIELISDLYSSYNQVKAKLVNKRKSLLSTEGKAEFSATIKLLEQSVTNYLDICDTPEKCEEYLTKLIVQIEELEGKFSEFDEFLEVISAKREEIYNAFEARKLYLTEQRNKKANQLFQAAERVLGAIRNKSGTLKSKDEINAYFAADLMVEKVRSISKQLVESGDTVKSDDLLSQLKTIREEIQRKLRDQQDLFTDGGNVINMGNHKFFTNNLALDLSLVVKQQVPHYHLVGTDFFEAIAHPQLLSLGHFWDQTLISENESVYRSEYLAFLIFQGLEGTTSLEDLEEYDLPTYTNLDDEAKTELIQRVMTSRYDEGYVKGIHEYDTKLILDVLAERSNAAGTLKYSSQARALAKFYWQALVPEKEQKSLLDQIKSAGIILSVFPGSREFEGLIGDVKYGMSTSGLPDDVPENITSEASRYLFDELSTKDHFLISTAADQCFMAFQKSLKSKKAETKFKQSLSGLKNNPLLGLRMASHWVHAFMTEEGSFSYELLYEVANLALFQDHNSSYVSNVSLAASLEGFKGSHSIINEGKYEFHLNEFRQRLSDYNREIAPKFSELQRLKKDLTMNYRSELKLESFKPRVLSSFVRNKLIDQVYFPLIGANLAKQIGTAGEGKRTDLMGLLLLVSPPGYGKTTLMEYIASRLGVIFMKINGPAIGHEVTSVDPADAPNAASAEELQKLNLSFEMGNNVMIYLDDIQHCNPEFLQKFISMCDAQRKIEGVYKGKTKTYDFRGKKVCVVMAGNPYTESGEKFQIPDMLSNRADVYNLGDVIGDTEEVFKLSYIENSLTSNPILSKLAARSLDDVHSLIKMTETGTSEGLKFEVNHTAEELQEYAAVLKHMMKVRDVVLKVNLLYIESAAMADEYRTEPPFKLQGSYRDMNKIVEKLLPMMNEDELETVIQSHYENEAQTLTSNAEANLLRFNLLTGIMTDGEQERWQLILERFATRQKQKGYGQNAQLAEGLENIADSLKAIEDQIKSVKQVSVRKTSGSRKKAE